MELINQNIIYLGLSQLSRYAVPIITLPILATSLGIESYGVLVFYTFLSLYVGVITQYAFDVTATAEVANDKSKVNEIFWSVCAAKFALAMIGVLVAFCFILFSSSSEQLTLFTVILLGTVVFAFNPLFVYQGLEIVKISSFSNIISRLFTIPLVLLYVNSPSDLMAAALIQSASQVVPTVFNFLYLFCRSYVSLPNLNKIKPFKEITQGWEVFVSSMATNIYTNSVPVIIGVLLGTQYVGIYNIANTVRVMIVGIFSSVCQAVFPKINSKYISDTSSAIYLYRKYFKASLFLSFLCCSFVFIFINITISLVLGDDFLKSAEVVRVILFSVPLSIANSFLGYMSLVPAKRNRDLLKSISIASIISIPTLITLTSLFGLVGSAFSIILIEVFIMLALVRIHKVNSLRFIFNG